MRLLRGLYRKGNLPPHELASEVVNRGSKAVRRWFAKHARYVDYSEDVYDHSDYTKEPVTLHPERNLRPLLRADADPLVRAAYFENPDALGFDISGTESIRLFEHASQLDRLALVRNPNLSFEFIVRLFEFVDPVLPITVDERTQLIVAFLSNEKQVDIGNDFSLQAERRFKDAREGFDIVGTYEAWERLKEHFQQLWFLASQWPMDSVVPWTVFTRVGVDDETKARYYASWSETPSLRREVLRRNTLPTDVQLLGLARADADEECRRSAISKSSRSEREKATRTPSRFWSLLWHLSSASLYAGKILLIFLLFSVTTSRWETVALASLILIFEAVAAAERSQRWSATHQLIVLYQHVARLRALLNEKLSDGDTDAEADAVEEEAREIRKAQVRTWIASAAASVIVVVAMWNLLTAVLGP